MGRLRAVLSDCIPCFLFYGGGSLDCLHSSSSRHEADFQPLDQTSHLRAQLSPLRYHTLDASQVSNILILTSMKWRHQHKDQSRSSGWSYLRLPDAIHPQHHQRDHTHFRHRSVRHEARKSKKKLKSWTVYQNCKLSTHKFCIQT